MQHKPPPAELPEQSQLLGARDALRALAEVALPIARERASLLGEMRDALDRGDERLVIALARRLTGRKPPHSANP